MTVDTRFCFVRCWAARWRSDDYCQDRAPAAKAHPWKQIPADIFDRCLRNFESNRFDRKLTDLASPQMAERGVRGLNAAVLGLFEDRVTAQIGVGKEERPEIRLALIEEAGRWAGHGVAEAHDVDAGDAIANVGVGLREVVENRFFPEVPVLFEEHFSAVFRRHLG